MKLGERSANGIWCLKFVGFMFEACEIFHLKVNPCTKAGSIGSKNAVRNGFWTVEEFKTFADGLYDNWDAYIGFNLLFWTGMRIGEFLALNVKDFDLKAKAVFISKSY